MIGIIGAMKEEIDLLCEQLEDSCAVTICGTTFRKGRLDHQSVVIAHSGVGKVNAALSTTVLISHFHCDFIINTGIAGGIFGVKTEEIVIGQRLKYYDVDCTFAGYAIGQVPQEPAEYLPDLADINKVEQALQELNLPYRLSTIYSGDCFVDDIRLLAKVDTSGCCVAEMEGAAVAYVAAKSGVRFLVLRYVSDLVGMPNQIEDYQAFEQLMARRSALICLRVLKKLA